MNKFLKQRDYFLLQSFLCLAFLLLPSCANTQNNQPMIINMNYHEVRDIILQNGWKPAQGMPAYDEIGATAHYFRDLGYTEVYDCTGAGLLSCLFYFQNEKGEYLKIGTAGEYSHPSFDLDTRVVYTAVRDQIDE